MVINSSTLSWTCCQLLLLFFGVLYFVNIWCFKKLHVPKFGTIPRHVFSIHSFFAEVFLKRWYNFQPTFTFFPSHLPNVIHLPSTATRRKNPSDVDFLGATSARFCRARNPWRSPHWRPEPQHRTNEFSMGEEWRKSCIYIYMYLYL